MAYFLLDCVEANKLHPETFEIPTNQDIANCKEGDYIRLIFKDEAGQGERMWVQVTKVNANQFEGTLTNAPIVIADVKQGDTIPFEARHVASISTKEEMDKLVQEAKESEGKLPTSIPKLIDLLEEFKSLGQAGVFKLHPDDEQVLTESVAAANQPNQDLAYQVSSLWALEKAFLYICLIIVCPQIYTNNDIKSVGLVLIARLKQALEKSILVIEQIEQDNQPLLVEFKKFFPNNIGLADVPDSDLGRFFVGVIDDTLAVLR